MERIPPRALTEIENYYHIPKKLGLEMGPEEGAYSMARMLFDMQQEREEEAEELAYEERQSRLSRRHSVSASNPSGHIPGTPNVA